MIYSDYKQYVVETSIGLQDVDHLKNSKYFLELSNKYIKGEISLNQLDELITTYYKSKPDDESKQPDIASSNMFNILSCDNKFELSVKHFCDIHRKIFEGVFDHPGALRTYNIQKAEWVLGGDTVVYGDYRSLYDTISYDIQAEKDFDYDGLSIDEKIKHLAQFIANIWQNHIFGEGNTRTVSIFFIQYLNSLGFNVTNDAFAANAWYFRNCLVRANYSNYEKNISEDKSFLIRFLRNLLLGENNRLLNRELHVQYGIHLNKTKDLSNNEKHIIDLIKHNPSIKTDDLAKYLNVSLRTVKSILLALKEAKLIKRIDGKRYGYWKVLE